MIPFIRSAISSEPHARRLTPRQAGTTPRSLHGRSGTHPCQSRLPLRPARARRLPSKHTRPRPTPGRTPRREPTNVSHPQHRPTGPNPAHMEGRILGILRYWRSQQRPHRSHQRNHRTRQTNRQRLPQPHQLPTPNAPHRRRLRRLHPHSTLKTPQTVCSCWSRSVYRTSKRSPEPCVVDSSGESVCSPPVLPRAP